MQKKIEIGFAWRNRGSSAHIVLTKVVLQKSIQKTSVKAEKECLDYLSQVNTPHLSPEEKGLCERKLSLQEYWNALNSMKNGKSPGSDGLTKEFYAAFFGELGSLLLKLSITLLQKVSSVRHRNKL